MYSPCHRAVPQSQSNQSTLSTSRICSICLNKPKDQKSSLDGTTRIPVSDAGSQVSISTPRYKISLIQQSFEQLNPKCVAVVIDPIQSVRGKVVIDAFRLINPLSAMSGNEPRQTTAVTGHLNKPSIEAMYKGLNKYYYSININYKTNDLETKMLLNLYKQKWNSGLKLKNQEETSEHSAENFKKIAKWAEEWTKRI